MQITFNPFYTFNTVKNFSFKKNNLKQNHQRDFISLPNYNQVDKSLINFCGKKYKNPLNDYFGGYKKQKEFIDNILITPLNNKTQLPSSLLLAFADQYLQTQVIQGIIQTSDADFITISPVDDNLCNSVKDAVVNAREKYQKEGKQTVIIIYNAEKAIGMTPAYARELSQIPLSEEDFTYLKSCGTDLKRVNFFKSLLDSVNKTSFNANDLKSPATIIFTTQNPQYIHPDLITRDGKMKTVVFQMPCGKNTRDFIKFEAEKIKDKLKDLKDDKVDLSKNQIKHLNALRIRGKLEDLYIDVENIPFQKIMNYTTPNKKVGAYSNKSYHDIALKSLQDYIMEPKTPYSIHFIFNLASTPRDILPDRYQKYEGMSYLFNS